MKKVFLLFGIILPWVATAQIKFQEITLDEAMSKAVELKKDILVDVVSGRIDNKNINKVLENKELAKQIDRDFIAVRIDMMKKENAYFVPKVLGTPYPCVMLFTNQGENVGTGFWDEMATGRMNAVEIFAKAKAAAEVKRQNSCKIEFRDLSFPDALKAAKEENKLVFVDCVMKGCTPCRNMENNVFTLDAVANNYNRNFICIRSERETDTYDLASKYEVRGYPTFLFIRPDGTLAVSESGFLPSDKFQALAKRAIDGEEDDQEEVKSVPMMASTEAIPVSSSSAAVASGTASSAATTSMTGSEAEAVHAVAGESASKISFKKLTLEQAMAEAKIAKKLIYVDLSATWCGPCQQLKKVTFPNEMVADFMNKNFISIAFECDTDDISKEYRTKYKNSAFPTHLIIDENGELVHKFVGFLNPNDFVAELQKGTGTAKGLQYYNRKNLAGERSPEFMHEYIVVLANANEGGAAAKLAADYLNTLSADQLATRENFALVYEFARDIDGPVAQKVIKNQDKFLQSVGENELNNYLYMLWSIKADSYIREVDGKPVFDRKGYDETIRKLKASGFIAAEGITLTSDVRNAQRMGDWERFLSITTDYMKKKGAQASPMLTCNWGIDLKNSCNDKRVWKKYCTVMMDNFNQIKASGSEEAIAWEESMKALSKELLK